MTTTVRIESYFRIARDLDDASELLSRGLSRLAVSLGGCGSMAGSDRLGRSWGGEYDEAVSAVFDGVGGTTAAMVSLSGRLKQTAYNWAEADGTTGPLPGEDRALGGRPGAITPPTVPSVVGDSGPGLQGVIDLAGAIGVPVPNGNTGVLTGAESAWRRFADNFVGAAVDVLACGRDIIVADTSPEIDAIEAEFVDLQSAVLATATAAIQLSAACGEFGHDLTRLREQIRDEIEAMLAEQAVTAVIGIGLSLVTAGIAGAAAAGISTGRIAKTANVIRTAISSAAAVSRVARTGERVAAELVSSKRRLSEIADRAIDTFTGRAAAVPVPRKPVTYDPDKLNKKYDAHADAFGLAGNRNTSNLAEFVRRIDEFVADPDNTSVHLTDYRGQGPAIVTYNPETRLMVMQRPDGQFWSTWRLYPNQLRSLLETGTFR